jgi:hypothetical protein
MARKKPTRGGKDITRFEVRFPTDVHDGLQRLAAEADVSVSQLIVGVCRWAVMHGHAGEFAGITDDGGEPQARTEPRDGCLWFGPDDLADLGPGGNLGDLGPVFRLDYTDRRALVTPRQLAEWHGLESWDGPRSLPDPDDDENRVAQDDETEATDGNR